jgi:hypothetical protein
MEQTYSILIELNNLTESEYLEIIESLKPIQENMNNKGKTMTVKSNSNKNAIYKQAKSIVNQ